MREKFNINTEWKFELLQSEVDECSYIVDKNTTVNVPHTWNNVDFNLRQKVVYQKNIILDKKHANQDVFIEFLGVNSVARVVFNGVFLGEHRGGYSTFRFKINEHYNWAGENTLTVFVDNSITQDVSPLMGDFTIYGGIYRDVNIICVDKTHYDLEYFGSQGIIIDSSVNDSNDGVLKILPLVVTDEKAVNCFEIVNQSGEVVYKTEVVADSKENEIIIKTPILWNGEENPYMYLLKAYLKVDDVLCDYVEIPFGFRKCKMSPSEGFFLNDNVVRINGISKHQDFAEVGNAITKEMMDIDFSIIKEIGANSVRLSHYQHDDYFYELCDKGGLIVWAEIPMLSMPDVDGVLENAELQLKELVYQNIHHPSICFVGVQNEIAMEGESLNMYQGVNQLNDLVHGISKNIITTSANMYFVKNNSPLNKITDMQGYNQYYGWYYDEIKDLSAWIDGFHAENPNVALGISEYGADCNTKFHSEEPKVKDYTEEFSALYHEETYAIINSKDFLWGSYLWNLFDFGSSIRDEGGVKGQNTKGLVTIDRKIKKDAFYFYKAMWSKEPFVHITQKRFQNRHNEKMDVKVYSNLDKVTLFVNDVEVETQVGKHIFNFKNIALDNKETKVRVVSDDLEDSTVFIKVDEIDSTYVFVDARPGINVENWFTQKTGEVDLFPEDSYSILDTIGDLLENEEAWKIVCEMAPKAAERAKPGAEVSLLWVINKLRSIFDEDDVKKLNAELIKVKKIK